MASADTDIKSEIVSWLKIVLKDDNLKDIVIRNLKNLEKGQGYSGDVIFVTADGTATDGVTQEYNLVLKCSKRSKLVQKTIMLEAFINEMTVYEKIFPTFLNFQMEKQIQDIFDNFPQCYGTYTGEDIQLIVLEDLKELDYDLWPQKIPQNKNHIELIIRKYGQFHATSVAINKQQPETFQKCVTFLENSFKDTEKKQVDHTKLFSPSIEESYNLLKNDLGEDVLLKWRNFKDQIRFVMNDMQINHTGFKVIIHGDCWNNNFMFRYSHNRDTPLDVAFLDFQFSRYTSPIIDLSYFIFTCASQEELEDIENILGLYYNSFIEHLEKLQVQEPRSIYSFEQLMDDWRSYAKFGILFSSLLMKTCSMDQEEVVDIGDVIDSGKSFEDAFKTKTKNEDAYRKRIRPIVEYAVKNNLI